MLDKCIFCAGEDFKLMLKGHDYFYYCPHTFNLMKCKNCGQVGINPRPKNVSSFYREEPVVNRKGDIWQFLEPNRVKLVERIKKGETVFDVGCGSGRFLSDMKKRGWEVFGNELSIERNQCAKNFFALRNIYSADLLSIDLPEKFFDVVTLWHVLEHLENPREELAKVTRILKDDGVVIIEFPNFSSYQRRFFMDKWYALNIPRHIYHYDPEGVAKFLNSAGLKIFKSDYLVNARVDFITFKRSLLRYLHLELIPEPEGVDKSLASLGLKRLPIIFKPLRIVFEAMCLVVSLFLSLINCGNTFRIYCRKISN